MIELKVDHKKETASLTMAGSLHDLVHDLSCITSAVVENLLKPIDDADEVDDVCRAITTIVSLSVIKCAAERREKIGSGANAE